MLGKSSQEILLAGNKAPYLSRVCAFANHNFPAGPREVRAQCEERVLSTFVGFVG